MFSRHVPVIAVAALSVIVVHPAPAQTAPQNPAQVTQAPAPWPPPGVERAGKGKEIANPVVVKDVKPDYTREAMKAGIEGSVEMEAVVNAEGRVGEVRVTRSLDKQYGLDEQAIKAVKQWEFKPATKNGVAVPVLISLEMSFHLRK